MRSAPIKPSPALPKLWQRCQAQPCPWDSSILLQAGAAVEYQSSERSPEGPILPQPLPSSPGRCWKSLLPFQSVPPALPFQDDGILEWHRAPAQRAPTAHSGFASPHPCTPWMMLLLNPRISQTLRWENPSRIIKSKLCPMPPSLDTSSTFLQPLQCLTTLSTEKFFLKFNFFPLCFQ